VRHRNENGNHGNHTRKDPRTGEISRAWKKYPRDITTWFQISLSNNFSSYRTKTRMYPKTICPICNQTWSRVQLCIVRSERERSEREKDNTIRNNHFCYTLNKPSVDWHSTFQLVTRVRPYDAASEKSIEFKHESVAWNCSVYALAPRPLPLPCTSKFQPPPCPLPSALQASVDEPE